MDFQVDRGDLRRTRTVEADRPPLAPGQVRMAIERFAFTANNISYAVSGDLLDYWDFFPAEAPWGRIPVMGFGSVVESANPDVGLGGWYFGFYPMAPEHVVDAHPSATGFTDRAPHRQAHAGAYKAFDEATLDASFDPQRADQYLLLRGLFVTSFLVDDYLDDNDFHGAQQVLVTSASSKTSIALAHRLAARDGGPTTIGLTSARNRTFVEELGTYGEVVTYDEMDGLDPSVTAVVVDMAGSTEVLSTIHHHFGDALRYSCRVGATHWEHLGGVRDLPGPEPTFFFAPAQLKKRTDEWGYDQLHARMGAALASFIADATWLSVERAGGPDEVERVYFDTLEGRMSPAAGQILSLSPGAFAG